MHFQKFGKYEIVRKLSRSLTDVYLARDEEAGRDVVLKLIEHSRDDFTQIVIEAERRGALIQQDLHRKDPRILEVYDLGEEQNCFFVAMEYFHGRTLADILREDRSLDFQKAAHFAAEICNQLRTLHAFISDVDGHKRAVVHGDIKPSNLQISATGELRLIDFGIAKLITLTHNLTHHNLGSPSYCSPERLSWARVDAHADLWALGVTLYEMVCGNPPFQAENTRKLENLILSRRPLPALPDDCPIPLKAIVTKSLASQIDRRYQSAELFEKDLRAFLAGRSTVAEFDRRSFVNASDNVPVRTEPSGAATVRREPAKALPFKLPSFPKDAFRRDRLFTGAALLGGLVLGSLVFVPLGYLYHFSQVSKPLRATKDYSAGDGSEVSSDWRLYQQLKKESQPWKSLSPLHSVEHQLQSNFLSSAENVIDAYRVSTDQNLEDFDWSRAQLCLRHALEIDPTDAKAKGELALCTGYENLRQNPSLPGAMLSAISFRQAESSLPHSPDPHLALARLYVYSYRNIGPAIAEFHQAEQLGYHLGPREAEQQADGYLYRIAWDMLRAKYAVPEDAQAKWLQLAQSDSERARQLYEPLAGFSKVSVSLGRLYSAQAEQAKLTAKTSRASLHRRPFRLRYMSSR
jgi:serine/threonine protein kinase